MSGGMAGPTENANTTGNSVGLTSANLNSNSSNTANTAGNTSATTNPWAPAVPMLSSLLGDLGGISSSLTPEQRSALGVLQSGASSIPGFGGAAASGLNDLFTSSTAPEQGMLTSAYSDYKKQLAPYTGADYLDPYKNPAIKGYLDTTNQDISNQIDSKWAAAGRDLSPGHAQALARGLSQGESGILTNQYNSNVAAQQGADASLFGAGSGTASGTAALKQQPLQNRLAATSAAGAIPGLYTAPGSAMLSAANLGYGAPISNITGLLGPIAGIAGLGTSATGTSNVAQAANAQQQAQQQGANVTNTTGTQQKTTQTPWGPTIAGGLLSGASLFG